MVEGKSPGSRRTDKTRDFRTRRKTLQGKETYCCSVVALRDSLCDSRLTDAYAMHFVSRRALLLTVGRE